METHIIADSISDFMNINLEFLLFEPNIINTVSPDLYLFYCSEFKIVAAKPTMVYDQPLTC